MGVIINDVYGRLTAVSSGIRGAKGADSTVPGPKGDTGDTGADSTVPGPSGVNGIGFTGGSYSTVSGIVTFTSDDGLGFVTDDLRGTDGAGGGDVFGPATNHADYIPQWDGADSKTLKDGIPITAAGKNLIDDADASAQRSTLGLGTVAVKNFWTGTGAEYTALGTYDADTIYFLTSAVA